MWGKAAKWLLGVMGAAVLTLVGYVVENGELPAWLAKVISIVSGGLTVTTPWAVWELVLPILIIGGASITLLLKEAAQIQRRDDQIAELSHEIQSVSSRLEDMDKEYGHLKAEHEALIQSCSALEASNAQLLELNVDLKRKLGSVFQNVKLNDLSSSALSEEQLSVFEYIGERVDLGQRVTKAAVIRDLRVSLLTAEDNLDTLCELGFLKKVGGVYDAEWYLLTKAGRTCYLELKRKAMLKPPTRQG